MQLTMQVTMRSAIAGSIVAMGMALTSCAATSGQANAPTAPMADPLTVADIQAIGSHNSYKIAIPPAELAMIAATSQELADSLDYSHLPLADQLNLGIRQLEIDVIRDPEGGRFATPLLPGMMASTPDNPPYDATGMDMPGYKVLHVQDIDQRSHCPRFVTCLQQIDEWSRAHPQHAPLLILLNLKSGDIELPGSAKTLPFDAAAFDALDAEIRATLAPERYITPDEVRGSAASLREAVTTTGWPTLSKARGRLIFAIDAGSSAVRTYLRGKESLQGHPMFVASTSPDADHAAYFTINNPLRAGDEIRALVAQGFLIRTRADADTAEARSGDTSRLEAALASGAQYISTDYYRPRSEWSNYQARLPNGAVVRCSPARKGCDQVSE